MATTDDNGASRTTNAAGTMTTVVMETTIPTETEVKKDGSMTSINNHHEHSNNKGENNEESRDGEGENYGSSSPATAWELFVTLFLPFVIDMFKYIMLGTVHFVQLSLGVVQQYIERSCGGVNSVNKNIGGTAGGIGTSVDPHEWPQQFLTALGVLTVFALVIHPDGFTWVVVGKIRDFVYTVFSVIANSWEVLGIFPTVAALMTLSALFFLVFLVLRTLTPKTPKRPSQQSQDKRKKKKKKDQKSRGGRRGDNHRNKNRSVPFRIQQRTEQQEEAEKRKLEAEKDADSVVTNVSSGSVLTPLPELSTSSEDPKRELLSSSRPESPTDPIDTPDGNADDNDVSGGTKKRDRVSSSATQDTTPSLDDISCSSTSVRSYPSVSVGSSRSKDKSRSSKPVRTPSRKGGKSSGTRSPKSSGGSAMKGLQTEPTATSTPSSRWDALKPGQKIQHQHEKDYRPGLVQRSTTRRGVNNYNQRYEYKSSFHTPPRSGIGSMNHQQGKGEARMGGNESLPSLAHNGCLPPPGFQDRSPSANQDPLCTFDSNKPSHDSMALLWLRNDASTDQVLVATPVFNEQSHTPSSLTPTVRESDWNDETQLFPSPSRSAVSKDFTHGSPTILDSPSRVGESTKYYSSSLKENPFDDSERQVEEELQELEQLGGQMAGSILDF